MAMRVTAAAFSDGASLERIDALVAANPGEVSLRFARACCLEDLARYEDLLQQVTGHWETISHYETLWPMQSYRDRDPTKLSAPILRGIENGERITPAAYRASLTWRETLRRGHAELSGRFDLLATLSATGAAPTFPQPGSSTFNELATLIGVPALSAPLLAAEGLPLGLQLIGFRDRDYALLEYARSLQPVAP